MDRDLQRTPMGASLVLAEPVDFRLADLGGEPAAHRLYLTCSGEKQPHS